MYPKDTSCLFLGFTYKMGISCGEMPPRPNGLLQHLLQSPEAAWLSAAAGPYCRGYRTDGAGKPPAPAAVPEQPNATAKSPYRYNEPTPQHLTQQPEMP